MRKLLFILLTVLSFSSYGQVKNYTVQATKNLQADLNFTWQGTVIKKDSVAYFEQTTDSIRFRQINGAWGSWYKRIKAINGLITSGDTVKLGGVLTEYTMIDIDTLSLTISGANAWPTLSVSNGGTGSQAQAINATSNSAAAALGLANWGGGYGLYSYAPNGMSVYGVSDSGAGLSGLSTSGTGVGGYSETSYGIVGHSNHGTGLYVYTYDNGLPVNISIQDSSLNSIIPAIKINNNPLTTNPITNELGTSIEFYLEDKSGFNVLSNKIVSKWTNGLHASRTSEFLIKGVQGMIEDTILQVSGGGKLTIDSINIKSGTPNKWLSLDANKNIVYNDAPAIGSLALYRLLTDHDSLSTLQEKDYSSLTSKPDLTVYSLKADTVSLSDYIDGADNQVAVFRGDTAVVGITTGSNGEVLTVVSGAPAWKTNLANVTVTASATTFAVASNIVKLTGDAGGNTIATITGGVSATLILIFVDDKITITDTSATTTSSINLSAAFTSAANTVLTLIHDGNKWYEVSRSVN